MIVFSFLLLLFIGRDGRDGREGPQGPRGLTGPRGTVYFFAARSVYDSKTLSIF